MDPKCSWAGWNPSMRPVGHVLKRISQVHHWALANILFQFDLPFLIFPLYIHYSLVKLPICVAHKPILCIHISAAAAAAKSLQSCLTLCNPIDGSPPGSPVPGILQARVLEWVAISFSNVRKWKVKAKSLSCVRLFTTPWTTAYHAYPSMGFSRQESWSGLPLPYPIHISRLC